MLLTPSAALEINAISESPHCSFFVDSTVVEDGRFHVLTKVDPVLFLLEELEKVMCSYR